MSSVTEGTRGLLINFLPFALMTIILAVTDCSICYVADAVYLRFTTEGFSDLIFLAASAGTLALNIIAAMIHASAICIACEYIFSEKKGKSGRRGNDNGNKAACLCFIPAEVAVSAQILFIISDGAVNPHRFFLHKSIFRQHYIIHLQCRHRDEQPAAVMCTVEKRCSAVNCH